jgi:hypothetical protein
MIAVEWLNCKMVQNEISVADFFVVVKSLYSSEKPIISTKNRKNCQRTCKSSTVLIFLKRFKNYFLMSLSL